MNYINSVNPLNRRDLQSAASILKELTRPGWLAKLRLDVLMPISVETSRDRSGRRVLTIQTCDPTLIKALLIDLSKMHEPDPNEVYADDAPEREFANLIKKLKR